MALKKCENCGVFFGAEGNEVLCKNCTQPKSKRAVLTGDIEHDKFANARAVVYDQPNVTPEELVNELKARGVEITIREVMKFVTDGRLTLITIDGGSYCSSCGTKIALGTMCKDCSKKLDKFRKPAVAKPVQEEHKKVGMHTKK
ncbi:MAG: hypothetical protein JEZ08_06570 [Clostridiales bacterium]|nr:hypothetical protein [Clostridiales bacterium]